MTKTETYHHGALRQALIQAAVEQLQAHGLEALSLRGLARVVGVSHNAPYMHFADKEALLAAISTQGWTLLAAEIDRALSAVGDDWLARLHAVGWAYVAFVLAHPGHAEVMFRHYDANTYSEAALASESALARLIIVLDEGQAGGHIRPQNSLQTAAMIWSLLHGLALILANQKMPPVVMNGAAPQQLTRQFVQMALDGLAG